jgi:hypothetical protein
MAEHGSGIHLFLLDQVIHQGQRSFQILSAAGGPVLG